MTLFVSLLVLAFLICVHEFGHFLAAKLADIKVEEFSIGLGPLLLQVKRGPDATAYSLRALPLGGYVKMAGMGQQEDHPKGFKKKPLGARFGVIAAGSLTNFLLAVVLFVFTFSVIGIPSLSRANVVGGVIPGTPAARAGLQAGDRIVSVAGVPTKTWDEVAARIHARPERLTAVVVERAGERRTFYLVPRRDPETGVGQIGIKRALVWRRQGFVRAVALGLEQSYTFAQQVVRALVGMAAGTVSPREVTGPVGITQMIGEAARGGLGYLLTLTAILSINLALVNLLPIPALDGSRLLFLAVEAVRKRPLDPEKENLIHLVGFALLMFLVIIITYNDLVRLFSGG